MRLVLFRLIPGISASICILFLLATALAISAPLNAAPAKGIGMWVWSESAFSTDEARQKLIRFCVAHQISHLDVHVKPANREEKPIVASLDAFKALVLSAGQHHITIAALRGSPGMFFPENHGEALSELRAIIAFSRTLPAGSAFKGIKYDVEPYRTKEWKAKGDSRQVVIDGYLSFLRKARDLLLMEAPHLWLAADTPFWWDKDELMTEFEGKTKRLSEHVQDLTDYITIMSYRRNVSVVISSVENERRYAKEIQKVIFPSLETVRLKQDPEISFWGLTREEFWDVVPQLLKIAETDPAIGGVMIHCYRSLIEKFDQESSGGTGKPAPTSRPPGSGSGK
jgi:hypothetical protein